MDEETRNGREENDEPLLAGREGPVIRAYAHWIIAGYAPTRKFNLGGGDSWTKITHLARALLSARTRQPRSIYALISIPKRPLCGTQ
jgi:hypothetical protein